MHRPYTRFAHAMVLDSRRSLIGRQLGPYEVVAHIGAGGMGEVYRARDTKLQRDVALKVLPDAVPERSGASRFVPARSARARLAQSSSYRRDLWSSKNPTMSERLVLELVEGPTLADRIALAPISLDEACSIATQIAAALEAAHQRGIVHRDLKPANVKIRPDGTVKVLDFGLAKATADDGRVLSDAPTPVAGGSTGDGVILGTTSYMAPEQARGRVVDKRADIWAFGCVLYEMLAGQSVFAGDTVSDTIVAILTREPAWRYLPAGTPATIRRLLRRCLEKDLGRRLRDIADARLEIDDTLAGVADGTGAAIRHAPIPRDIAFQRLTDFVGMKESPAVSPDGKMVAFVTLDRRPASDLDPVTVRRRSASGNPRRLRSLPAAMELRMRAPCSTTLRRPLPPSMARCGRLRRCAVRRGASRRHWAAETSATMAAGSHCSNRRTTRSSSSRWPVTARSARALHDCRPTASIERRAGHPMIACWRFNATSSRSTTASTWCRQPAGHRARLREARGSRASRGWRMVRGSSTVPRAEAPCSIRRYSICEPSNRMAAPIAN